METQKTVTEERGCPVVMTLDAGGTNLVFSAIRGGEEIVAPVVCPTVADDLEACLQRIASGFEQVRRLYFVQIMRFTVFDFRRVYTQTGIVIDQLPLYRR